MTPCDAILAFGGGEVWVRTPWQVWLTGGILALIAGMCLAWWLMAKIRGRLVRRNREEWHETH